jgi:hypothetical protein
LYDVVGPRSSSYGSRTYLISGVAKRLALGVIPTFGFNTVQHGPSSSHVGAGDVTLLGAYELTRFNEGSRMPATSFVLQETLPTGRYDRLGNNPSDGFGAGAYTTSLSLYSQTYFWLPNGRILRSRLDASWAFSSRPSVHDASVYGTQTGFRGRVSPGDNVFVSASLEYSMTRRWVLAADLGYGENGVTSVIGHNVLTQNDSQTSGDIRTGIASNAALSVVPAVEFNLTANLGVILGVRKTFPCRNSTATLTPVMAINFVR